jgi:hypothetical protein
LVDCGRLRDGRRRAAAAAGWALALSGGPCWWSVTCRGRAGRRCTQIPRARRRGSAADCGRRRRTSRRAAGSEASRGRSRSSTMPCRSALPNTAGEGQMGSKKSGRCKRFTHPWWTCDICESLGFCGACLTPHATSPPTRPATNVATWAKPSSQPRRVLLRGAQAG